MERRSALFGFFVFSGLLVVCFGFLLAVLSLGGGGAGDEGWGEASSSGSGPRVGVVYIEGEIAGSLPAVKRLHELREDPKIDAIVVRINSPGGAVAPSQEIYAAVKRARDKKKVVCSLGTLAASGGYYIAAACEKIVASSGTITGSIGVISQLPKLEGLMQLLHVDFETIKSGAMKDAGSPFRSMTADERKLFQAFVDDIYEQFLDDVATGRGLDKQKIRPLADGRILTGKQALAAGLVDEIGNFEAAIERAATLAGKQGKPVPVFPKRSGSSILSDLLRGAADNFHVSGPTIQTRDPRL